MKPNKQIFYLLLSILIATPCSAWPSRSPDSTKFQELPSGVANGSYDGTKVEELSDSKNSDEYKKAKERRRLDERSKSGYDLNSEERAEAEERSRGRLNRDLADPPKKSENEKQLEGDEGLD